MTSKHTILRKFAAISSIIEVVAKEQLEWWAIDSEVGNRLITGERNLAEWAGECPEPILHVVFPCHIAAAWRAWLVTSFKIGTINASRTTMTPTYSNSIALLIDADNAPAAKIEFILSELAAHGVVNIRRAYGNWTKSGLSGWTKVLQENSIQPMQSFDLVKGKNATDMALCIDAMDLLYTKNLQTFCLVSSDCDFTPLVQRLRADGKEVFGFGELKTPEPFIAACTRFIYLEQPKPTKSIVLKPKSGQAAPNTNARNGHDLKGNTKLINTLRNAVKASADDEGWANLPNIANRINNESPFDHRTYGFKKLVDLFEAIDLFEVKREKNGTHSVISVRIAKVGGKKLKPKTALSGLIDDDDIPF